MIKDTFAEYRYGRALAPIRRAGIRSAAILPLTAANRQLGAVLIGRSAPGSLPDLEFARLVANHVAVVIDLALRAEAAAASHRQLERELDRNGVLIDVSQRVTSGRDVRDLFRAVSAGIRRVMRCDSLTLTLPAGDGRHLRVHALDFPDGNGYCEELMLVPIDGSLCGEAFRAGVLVAASAPDQARLAPNMYRIAVGEGIHAACVVPLLAGALAIGTIGAGRRESAGFTPEETDFLAAVAAQVAWVVDNGLDGSRERPHRGALQPRDENRGDRISHEIVGTSPALRNVLDQVKALAPTDATVLLCGEGGTGKEVLARLIHDLSPRARHAFIRVHCAGTPPGVLEGELFGREMDAVAGPFARKPGKLELADQGTVFIDEVGDLPMDLQLKLLGALEGREGAPIGSPAAPPTNVRVVAATGRNLARLVDEGHFRPDLFHRLNICSIAVPPLRQRPEDIPQLVEHFVARYRSRFQKSVEAIPDATMRAMIRYPWPGNLRELESFIERAVILSGGPVLAAPLTELRRTVVADIESGRTLVQIERDGILQVLRECGWRVGGANGAARRLGVPRTTLIYKMRKLGLSREDR